MSRKKRTTVVLLLIAAMIWTGFIFSRSMRTSAESALESGRMTSFFETLLGGIAISERLVRKLAHFVEYLILALPLTGAALLARRRRLLWAAWGYTVLVALCDEFVVQALSGRGSRFLDVLIDSAGGLAGVLLMGTVFYILESMRRRTDENLLKK